MLSKDLRIGIGYDIHRLVAGRDIFMQKREGLFEDQCSCVERLHCAVVELTDDVDRVCSC